MGRRKSIIAAYSKKQYINANPNELKVNKQKILKSTQFTTFFKSIKRLQNSFFLYKNGFVLKKSLRHFVTFVTHYVNFHITKRMYP